MTEVIVHAGFHKTGTTSVQRFLQANAPALKPHVKLGLNYQARDLIQTARGYSLWRDPISLLQFDFRLEKFFRSCRLDPAQKLCLSIEELSGLLPGLPARDERPEVPDYGAAPVMAKTLCEVVDRVYDGRRRVSFYYSTRATDDWLTSVYWQHVKTQAMVEDLDEFRARYATLPGLDRVVASVQTALPETRIVTAALEDQGGARFGPATPLLDLLELPEAVLQGLRNTATANQAPDAEALGRMLALNRSGLDRDALKAAKRQIEAEVRAARADAQDA